MDKWNNFKWGELATLEYGKSLRDYHTQIEGVPVYGTNGKIGFTDKVLYEKPSVIIGRKGAYRGVHFSKTPFFVIDTAFYLKPKVKDIDPLFSYYQLKTVDIDSMDSGSAIPSTSREDFYDLDICLPSLKEQESIAEVLSSLDDKIDLLHRNNKTLEQLAETLFRQWFVEEADVSWEEGVLSDLFILQRGFDLPSQNRVEGNIPIITSGGIGQFHNQYKIKGPGIVTGRSGVLGNVFYVKDDFWPLNTTLFVSKFNRATTLFTYFFLKGIDLNSLNAGSAVPTLNRNHVHGLKVNLPPLELVNNFETKAESFFSKMYLNNLQIKQLESLRDTLLPKLMSGAVKVIN